MKKFTFKGVLDGIRSSVAPQIKPDQEIVETLRSDNFQVAKMMIIMGVIGLVILAIIVDWSLDD